MFAIDSGTVLDFENTVRVVDTVQDIVDEEARQGKGSNSGTGSREPSMWLSHKCMGAYLEHILDRT
jgi:hypothetical protein